MKLFRRKLWIFRPFYKLYFLDKNYYLIVTSYKDIEDYFEKVGITGVYYDPSVKKKRRFLIDGGITGVYSKS